MALRSKPGWTALVLLVLVLAGVYIYNMNSNGLRGEALVEAITPFTKEGPPEQQMVAGAILRSYLETRHITELWSGLYWGFAWAAAALGAVAGLVLKIESFLPNDKVRKDIAATLSVTAAVLITVSTGGEFQRKWQANRTAAAEIEHLGYGFLQSPSENPRSFLQPLSDILLRRQIAIIGSREASSQVKSP